MDSIKTIKKFYQLNIKELAYMKFVIESYDGVAQVRTISAKNGEIEVMIPACNIPLFNEILSDLKQSILIKEIEKPIDYFDLMV